MNGDQATKRVFRMLMPWNDEKEGRWLAKQEQSGWHLKAVRCFGGYVFERAAPADVAYRLDFGPSRFHDRSEYFGLFRDAGWEHVGKRGLWQYFRKAAVDGTAPEIYTDPQSRIAMYRRVIAIMCAMMAVMGSQAASTVSRGASHLTVAGVPIVLLIQVLLMALFAYGTVRLLLVISRLKRNARRESGLSQS
ncbi:MAG: DUF2812 domain-containing protein [Thermoanaerobaculales bacterium]